MGIKIKKINMICSLLKHDLYQENQTGDMDIIYWFAYF
jgi:hypothetical protein